MELFVTCQIGLEPWLEMELQELNCKELKKGYGGVYVQKADMKAIYRINYCSRIASRVLLPISRFKCFHKKDLYDFASDIDWKKYFKKNMTFAIDANVTHPNLRNSLFAAQVMKDAICDQLRNTKGVRPNVDVKNPDIQLNLFVHGNQASISFDTSGQPLHKRGYRQEGAVAPLKENLAAALLKIAGYNESVELLDPCCGSATFLVEAALIATNTMPGYLRLKWGFMSLPDFRQIDWLTCKNAADDLRTEGILGKIAGMDKDELTLSFAKQNIKASGMAKFISLSHADFTEDKPVFAPNLVVANPPYGARLESVDELKPLYRSLGDFLKKETAKPAKGFILTGSMELSKEVGLAAKRRHVINNGGIESRFLEFDLY